MNSSIKTKLLIGFGSILLLLITLALLMTKKLSETNQRLGNLVDISSQKINLSNEILIAVLQTTRHEKNIILEQDLAKMGLFKDRIYEAMTTVDKRTIELRELSDETGKKILDEFKNLWDNYREDVNEIVSLTMKYQNDKATQLSVGKSVKVKDQIVEMINRIIEKNRISMINEKKLSDEAYQSAIDILIILIVLSFSIALAIAYWIIRSITTRISYIATEAERIASREYADQSMADTGKDELNAIFNSLVNVNKSFNEITLNANTVALGNYTNDFTPRSERDTLGIALKKMTVSLRETTAENEKNNWLTTGQNQLNEKLRGDQTLEELSNNILAFLCTYLNASVGALYLTQEDNVLTLSGKFAFSSVEVREKFTFGEGLIGQVALERKALFLTDMKEEHIRLVSTLINSKPRAICIIPFLFEGSVLGVIEIGHMHEFGNTEKEFIGSAMESIGISVNSAMSRKRIQQLLEETQVQSEELQSQQEELKQVNEELEEQAQNLKQQQEELQMTNEELEEQTQALELKNREVELAKLDIEEKTKQLEISSKYKSEFLANMSHELRTPLNSLLILSKDLADNKPKNLLADQIESAEIINKSGHDLLTLINEVLDLSKIEAGKMTLNIEQIYLKNFIDGVYRDFKHHAEQKSLRFKTQLANDLPEFITSDSQRLNQILKNLLSNAIKFTAKGEISISVERAASKRVAFSVSDTGIGIAQEKQMAIFEAFQQADGGTSRKYGGTGLGLSISRELAKLLKGEISLSSKVNEGSVFTLTIPFEAEEEIINVRTPRAKEHIAAKTGITRKVSYLNYPCIEDDRETITQDDKVVLIIEDDLNFAVVLRNQAKSKGFKSLNAATGEDGLFLAEKYKPNAIILDIDLPGINGNQVLMELKSDPSLRHIPVHIISVNERSIDAIKDGAIEYLTKPVDKKQIEEAFSRMENFIARKMKNLLIIEDDANSRKAIKKLIGNGDVKSLEAGTGKEALDLFSKNHIDCIVLDIGLPDITGFELIRQLVALKKDNMPPVIVYTGRELTKEENSELEKYAETIIIKGAKSEERLLDETALFLHRTIQNLPEFKQKMITSLYDKEQILASKKVLLVDDDMRNVFALSKILKERGMEIIKAENGIIALKELDKNQGIDIVLMDIMMPEMDGYEAMQKIRLQQKHRNLPVIALTAKAMKEDKQKCIDAGANDYIAKPVDVERLLSLMRVWLSK